ncbi:hypothetical protein QTS76_36870, partial [Micromonospora sp. b486]|nr:hypothetical protein [Micromonospora sp. b486]
SWHWIFLINCRSAWSRSSTPSWLCPGQRRAVRVVRLPRHAHAIAGSRAVPLRISTLPETGTVADTKVWLPMLVGGALVVAFVLYSFGPGTRCSTCGCSATAA